MKRRRIIISTVCIAVFFKIIFHLRFPPTIHILSGSADILSAVFKPYSNFTMVNSGKFHYLIICTRDASMYNLP